MNLNDLKKELGYWGVDTEPDEHTSPEDSAIDRFRGKPFWIFDNKEHEKQRELLGNNCCFNHIVGMPIRDGKEMPMFDYEEAIYNTLQDYDRLWIKKSRGLGVTEFFLRYMAWLCLKDNEMRNCQMAIVVGPNAKLGTDLLTRFRERTGLDIFFKFDTDKATVKLNGCTITAYPSNHTETLRSPEAMKFIFLDEADFFAINEWRVIIDAIQGYRAKTRPLVVMVSTPNLPGGNYDQSEKDAAFPYHKLFIMFERGMPKLKIPNEYNTTDWISTINLIVDRYDRIKLAHMPKPEKMALGKLLEQMFCANPDELTIYRLIDIVDAALESSFQREYNGQYGYGTGNLFGLAVVDAIEQDYDLKMQDGEKILAVDPAYGNADKASKFGIVGFEQKDGIIYVRYAKQIERASQVGMVEEVIKVYHDQGYHMCLVDGSQAGIIRDLQTGVAEWGLPGIPVMAVNFREKLTEMSTVVPRRCREKRVRISPMFPELLNQLRAVETDEKGHPNKKRMNFDLGDAFLMGVNQFSDGVVLMDAI